MSVAIFKLSRIYEQFRPSRGGPFNGLGAGAAKMALPEGSILEHLDAIEGIGAG